MYDIKHITGLVEDKIAETDIFIVDVHVSFSNKISVFLDCMKGINIDECVDISRYIESKLDREKEDFELEVSSAGVGYPFKVEKQYLKNINKEVEILMNTGEKLKGILKAYNAVSLDLEVLKKIKQEGNKKKITVKEIINLQLNKIKSTKQVLSI